MWRRPTMTLANWTKTSRSKNSFGIYSSQTWFCMHFFSSSSQLYLEGIANQTSFTIPFGLSCCTSYAIVLTGPSDKPPFCRWRATGNARSSMMLIHGTTIPCWPSVLLSVFLQLSLDFWWSVEPCTYLSNSFISPSRASLRTWQAILTIHNQERACCVSTSKMSKYLIETNFF
jgi:hypothetical protein